ncbi:MAG: hypothetical protein ACI4KR_12630 [Ruminiclostridium sp.]
MKTCTSCGVVNKDENRFCSACGGSSFAPVEETAQQVQQPQLHPAHIKPPFTGFDLMSVLGFVASLVGLFQISLILEPLAAITSILGFIKGQRNKGLAAAGFIISVIGLIIRLFMTLYHNNLIPKWLMAGAFE